MTEEMDGVPPVPTPTRDRTPPPFGVWGDRLTESPGQGKFLLLNAIFEQIRSYITQKSPDIKRGPLQCL